MRLGLFLGLSRTLSGGGGLAVDHYDYTWSTAAANAGWTPSDGRMLAYAFGKWWTTGGWTSNPANLYPGGVKTTNEVWSSPDLATWTQELAFSASPPTSGAGARFKRRHYHGFLPHTHAGTPYLYVLGGDHESSGDADFAGSGGFQSDIWRSPNGTTWERVMASGGAPWAPRMLQAWGSSGAALWAFGGTNALLGGGTNHYNDLWTSTDGGPTWTLVTMSNPPAARGVLDELVYWNGRMWLLGGGTYNNTASLRSYFADVYSFDPNNTAAGWTRHANPPWVGTQYHAAKKFNNRLWVLAGFAEPGLNNRFVFSSGDGERWTQEERPPWARSHADGVAANDNILGFVHGNGGIVANTSGVFKLTATADPTPDVPTDLRGDWDIAGAIRSGANITSVPDLSGNANPLIPTVSGDATYNASDADYGNVPSANSDGGFFLRTQNAVNLSSFTLFMVIKPATTDGLYYYCYSLTTGPVRYMYLAGNRTGAPDNQILLQADVFHGGVSTTGNQSGITDKEAIRHIVVFHYDGTAAGSFIRIDGAQVFPDDNSFAGNAGTAAWSSILYFLSDNTGAGSKAGSLVRAKLHGPQTLEQIQAVERELAAAYPYKAPT